MKWTKNGNLIQDDYTGRLVAVLPEDVSELDAKIIENAPTLLLAAMKYCKNIEESSHKPKKTYSVLKSIISEIPQFLLNEIELSGILEQE